MHDNSQLTSLEKMFRICGYSRVSVRFPVFWVSLQVSSQIGTSLKSVAQKAVLLQALVSITGKPRL
jgi:hypothetical protein